MTFCRLPERDDLGDDEVRGESIFAEHLVAKERDSAFLLHRMWTRVRPIEGQSLHTGTSGCVEERFHERDVIASGSSIPHFSTGVEKWGMGKRGALPWK